MYKKIREAYIAAFKAKDIYIKQTLSSVISSLDLYAKENKIEALSDEDTLKVLVKEIKKRKESVEAFQKAEKPNAAMVLLESRQIEIIEGFMPQPISDEELIKKYKEMSEQTPSIHPGKILGEMLKITNGSKTMIELRKLLNV